MTAAAATYPDLKGRVAAVTGGGRGLGKAMALSLAANGAHVLVGSLSLEESEDVATEIRRAGGSAVAHRLDVVRREDCEAFVRRAVEAFGSLDVMVCNAGISPLAPALDTDAETWRRTIDVDLTGAFNTAVAAGRRMVESGAGGSIVLTSSTAAQVAFERLAAYGAAKGAINQLVRSLAMEWGPQGVRVNAVAPGWTDHRMQGNASAVDPAAIAKGIERTPLRRVGKPSEIAAAVLFLASDASSFITGAVIPVDGGYTAA